MLNISDLTTEMNLNLNASTFPTNNWGSKLEDGRASADETRGNFKLCWKSLAAKILLVNLFYLLLP